jgi:D-alanine--poly(phosphoribitol) ligase subunit 1
LVDVIDRILKAADQFGDRTAVQLRDGSVTFAELVNLARQYAALFSATGSPKVLVALDQGADAYASMFGTMMAGGLYAPINTASPHEKIAAICAQFQPTIIVCTERLWDVLGGLAPNALRIRRRDVEGAGTFPGAGARNALAYVIFTSGSTGKPKGVAISHGALSHYIDWVVDSRLFEPGDRVSQYTNIAFDVSVLDIFGALCSGATIVPFVSRSDRLMPAPAVKHFGVTVWVSVPSVIGLMMRAKQLTAENVATVRRYFFAGEPLLETHVNEIFTVAPDAQIWNAYGPTETTVTMTSVQLLAGNYRSFLRTSIALGDPIPGMEVHLVGEDAPDVGEIVIVGPQLADGYWNADVLTARSFRSVELDGSVKRAYFSGDVGRRVDGQLYFESRLDHQVKIDGFRVELHEISAAIRSSGWPEVLVIKLNDKLTAVIERKPGGQAGPSESELHLRLQQMLDWYAVPAHYVFIDQFPRTHNDKIDAKAIRELAAEQLEDCAN